MGQGSTLVSCGERHGKAGERFTTRAWRDLFLRASSPVAAQPVSSQSIFSAPARDCNIRGNRSKPAQQNPSHAKDCRLPGHQSDNVTTNPEGVSIRDRIRRPTRPPSTESQLPQDFAQATHGCGMSPYLAVSGILARFGTSAVSGVLSNRCGADNTALLHFDLAG